MTTMSERYAPVEEALRGAERALGLVLGSRVALGVPSTQLCKHLHTIVRACELARRQCADWLEEEGVERRVVAVL